jgi:tight adherence protein C
MYLEEKYWRRILARRLLGKSADAEKIEKRTALYWQGAVKKLGLVITPKKERDVDSIKMLLSYAGYRNPDAPAIYYGLRAWFAIGLALFFMLAIFLNGEYSFNIFLMSFVPAAFGYYLPALFIRIKAKSRQNEIFKELPDALDLVLICLEAGLGFDAALFRVSRELSIVSPVLSEEFSQYFLEIQTGLPRRIVLKNLSDRNGVKVLSSVVNVLLQSAKLGTDVAHALQTYIQSMRTERKQTAEEKGGKISTKLVFPLVLFILPALFVIVLSPAVINVLKTLNKL